MTDVPQAAIDAAYQRILRRFTAENGPPHGDEDRLLHRIAEDAAEAAAPAIRAAERERCRRGVAQCCGSETCERDGSPGAHDGWRCGTCDQGTGLIGGIA